MTTGFSVNTPTLQADGKEVKPILGLPDDISTYAMIPIGYPRGKFGPVSRVPVEEVTRVDRWDSGKKLQC